LVRKRETGTFEARDKLVFGEGKSVFVMQRSVEGDVDSSMYREGDIAETKGLAVGFSCGGVEVLSGPEQPEEGQDNELDGVLLEVPQDGVINIEQKAGLPTDQSTGYATESLWRALVPLLTHPTEVLTLFASSSRRVVGLPPLVSFHLANIPTLCQHHSLTRMGYLSSSTKKSSRMMVILTGSARDAGSASLSMDL
jgi:hypothetical protein